jgi:hypothetical protein
VGEGDTAVGAAGQVIGDDGDREVSLSHDQSSFAQAARYEHISSNFALNTQPRSSRHPMSVRAGLAKAGHSR